MHEARPDEGRIGFEPDAHGRRRVRHWYPSDLRDLAIAFGVSIVVVVLAAVLLEWAAAL